MIYMIYFNDIVTFTMSIHLQQCNLILPKPFIDNIGSNTTVT